VGVFEQFPYTNFHNLNLDWILQTMKEYGVSIAEFETRVNDLIIGLEKSSDITDKRKLSATGDFTGTIAGKKVSDLLADLLTFETKTLITTSRRLSPTGNFTGDLNGKPVINVLGDITNALSLCQTLIGLVNDRESIGTIYDGGLFDGSPIVNTIEGGLF
jgi:hypothetical protein